MKVRVEVNGKKLAITMYSRTVMDLSLYLHAEEDTHCRAKTLSWFFELDFRVRIRYGFRVGFAKKNHYASSSITVRRTFQCHVTIFI